MLLIKKGQVTFIYIVIYCLYIYKMSFETCQYNLHSSTFELTTYNTHTLIVPLNISFALNKMLQSQI